MDILIALVLGLGVGLIVGAVFAFLHHYQGHVLMTSHIITFIVGIFAGICLRILDER